MCYFDVDFDVDLGMLLVFRDFSGFGDVIRLTFELSGWPAKPAASAPPRFFQSAEVIC